MKSIMHALTWEFLSHNSGVMLLVLAIGNGLPLLVLAALSGYQVDLNSAELVVLQSALVPFTVFLLGLAVLVGQGPIGRLYLKPISTASLVACFFIPSAIWTGIGIAGSLALWNYLFDLNWPIAWPTLFGVTFWAALWPSIRVQIVSPVRIMEALVVVVLMWIWCFGVGSHRGAKRIWDWNQLGVLEYLTVFATIAAGYWLSVRRTANDRCGRSDSWIVEAVRRLTQAWDGRRSLHDKQLKSAWLANYWYERSCRGLPYVVGIGMLLSLLALASITSLVWFKQAGFVEQMRNWGEGLAAIFMMHVLAAGLWGFLAPMLQLDSISDPQDVELAELARNRGGAMSEFRSALPITDTDLSRSVLYSIGISLLAVFVMFAILGLGYVIAARASDSQLVPTTDQVGQLPWLLMAGTLGSWVAMSNATMLAYWGRWLINVAIVIGLVAIQPASLFSSAVVGTMLLILMTLVTGIVFAAAIQRAYINKVVLVRCVVIASLLAGLFSITRPSEAPLAATLFSTSLALLAILPVAGMPLAIASSRRQ